MRDAFEAQLARFEAWREKLVRARWIGADEATMATGEASRTAGGLFASGSPRPLVVALFGGTGVGKSSLLNRLAGGAIARVGVVRPTSQELTAYVHESVQLADLPPEIASDRIRIVRHAAPGAREILWIDTPDVDSTEESNRALTLEILPRCDLVAYVVSPEKYADRRAWNVLRERGGRHGWMFVFNHWDSGDPSQREQFVGMLRGLGFASPQVFATCCASGVNGQEDEFEALQAALQALLREHGVRELERLGILARVNDLTAAIDGLLASLGSGRAWQTLGGTMEQRWSEACEEIRADAEIVLRGAAAMGGLLEHGGATRPGAAGYEGATGGYVGHGDSAEDVGHGGPTLQGARRGVTDMALRAAGLPVGASSPKRAPESAGELLESLAATRRALWDARAESLLEGVINRVEVTARHAGVSAQRLRDALDAASRDASVLVGERVDAAARRAVAAEGGALRRGLVRGLGVLSFVLPVIAGLSVAGVAVWTFIRAATGQQEFLGSDFLIHGLILVAVAWGLPYAAYRWLRSSPRQEAIRGMRSGMADGLEAVSERLRAAFKEVHHDARKLGDEGKTVCQQLTEMIGGWMPGQGTMLGRVVQVARLRAEEKISRL